VCMTKEPKTKKNDSNVDDFLDGIEDNQRRNDAKTVTRIMEEITGVKPIMWGSSIVGFGTYHYIYASGHEGDWPRIGLSPRKQYLTIYLMDGFAEHSDLLSKLGKHKTSKACLYINKLDDVDINALREMIKKSYESKATGKKA